MAILTRDEAVRRAALLGGISYQIDLDLTRGAERFGSTTVVRFECLDPGASTFVELKPVALRRVLLNGVALDPVGLDDGRLALEGLAATNELVVEAEMAYSHTGEGLHRYVDPADGEVYLYAQSFLDDAQRIFACFDQPDLKAPVSLSATAPPEWTVIGNGAGRQVAPGRWEFAQTKPLSTYFVTLAAGPWRSRYAEHDGIPLGLHCRRSLASALDADVEEIFTVTRQSFDRYHELFDVRYPFGKYDQVFVPEFNAGAMENPGCVTIRDEMFLFRSAATDAQRETRAMVIAHEMAHMWFGDLVTMRWWDDLWLNESFAEYLGHRVVAEVTRFREAWTAFSLQRKGWGYAADQRPSTHPVSGEVTDTSHALLNFDGISYAKGASALRQLVTWMGDEAFFAGLNAYFARHAYGNASLADLLGSLAEHTDRDLDEWSRRWLTTVQVNTLRTHVTTGADRRLTEVGIEQTAPEAYPTLRPHRVALGSYDAEVTSAPADRPRGGGERSAGAAAVPDPAGGGVGAIRRRSQAFVDLEPTVGRTAVPELVGQPRPALLMPNDGDLTYAKLRLDPYSWRTVAERLHQIDDSLTRAQLWYTAWDMTRDAELPVSDYLALVRAHLPYETAVSTLESVLRGAKSLAIDRYTPAAGREAALATLAAACGDLLARSALGSSAQLAAVRGLAGCAIEPADLSRLRGWLSDVDVPEGVRVDSELRWSVLLRLVVTGLAGPDEIDAELARDPGDEGQRGALRCRAALPDPAAKARAWDSIVGDELSAHLLLATVEGFWQSEQAGVLEEYLARYFQELPAVTARRSSPEIDRVLGRFGFPGYAVRPDLVTMAEKLLGRPDVSAALARHVADQLDETRRALAAIGSTPAG
jgi:aminopeptidase N